MDFKKQLNEIQKFLSEKKKFSELALRSGVSLRTVYNVFSVNNFDELKGVQINVYEEAIKMVNEIKSLPALAAEALRK